MAGAVEGSTPSSFLDNLAQEALLVAKKASRHRKALAGDNFYGNKLAQLRVSATNAFADLQAHSPGDTSALAELIAISFSADTAQRDRVSAVRELSYALRTKWSERAVLATKPGNELFPLALATKTGRSYIVSIVTQMNGCFKHGWYDAAAVMMRRLVENVIIEAFESRQLASEIKDAAGNYLQLSALIDRALAQSALSLSRNTKRMLPQLRNLGHMSAHGRYFNAMKSDIEKVEDGVRVVTEEFLHLASLL
jgi:hypothetical protein